MGKPTAELARREREIEAYKDWIMKGRKHQNDAGGDEWFGIPIERLGEIDREINTIKPKEAVSPFAPASLIAERGKTHGDWTIQSRIAQQLKFTVADNRTAKLTPSQAEAIDMILVKISRILAGDPNEPDHWNDIQGYALLGKQGHST